jgi:hypothetical protein
VLGALAFLAGLVLLVRHAIDRRAPLWATVAVLGAMPTLMTEDWLLGGTNGAIWALLLAAEVAALRRTADDRGQPAARWGAA